MPTYHYRCTDCGADFEEWQKITDPCPKCEGTVQRVIHGGAGLLFKGDGFYITDYRSAGYKKDAKKDTAGSSTEKSSSEAKKPDSGAKTSE